MEVESKTTDAETNARGEATTAVAAPAAVESDAQPKLQTKKASDDEEEDEEDEEDKIVEKSHNGRFHKRNKRFPKQIEGVHNTYIAIEPKSGKEVIWNERDLPEKKVDREARFLTVVKKLKRHAHPFLVRFLDAWITKTESGRKLMFITERLDEGTLKQFICNSTRTKLLWRRHIGQLLSVLIFLHHLGVTHGNLTKETIYYQNSGCLKVGPFGVDGFFGQRALSDDIFALGLLALEIAVWSPSVEAQINPPSERIQQMFERLVDQQQRSFIEACLDPNPNSRPKIKALLNHPAVAEVPTLKLLSAKVLVSSMRTGGQPEETGCIAGTGTVVPAETQGFARLLKDNLSYLEDETVIVEAKFPRDQVTKSRLWKDFRSNFTFTTKYLEDVKNGFYPFLGYRFGSATEADEEDDAGVSEAAVAAASATVIGVTASSNVNVSGAPAANKISHSSLPGHILAASSPVASSTTSRKHSSNVVDSNTTANDDTGGSSCSTSLPTSRRVSNTTSCSHQHQFPPPIPAETTNDAENDQKVCTSSSPTGNQHETYPCVFSLGVAATGGYTKKNPTSFSAMPIHISSPALISTSSSASKITAITSSVGPQQTPSTNTNTPLHTEETPDEAMTAATAESSARQLLESARRRSLPGSLSNFNSAAHQLKDYLQGIMLTTRSRDMQTATDRREKRIQQLNSEFLSPRLDASATMHQGEMTESDKMLSGREMVTPPSSIRVSCTKYLAGGSISGSGSFPPFRHPQTPRASVVSADRSDLNAVLIARGLLPYSGLSPSKSVVEAACPLVLLPRTDSAPNELRLPTKNSQAGEEEDDADALDDEDDDEDDNDDDDEKEEDDEYEDGKVSAGEADRMYAQVVHVGAPVQAPTTAALFTHCQYSYIGSGRWQVYVQMWFVEERLKREAYLQVLDYEWHDYDRVADLFEASKCLSNEDRATLVRLLAMARHNMPLIKGEIVYPTCSFATQSNGINKQELYSKLVALHLHQNAHELLARDVVFPKQAKSIPGTPDFAAAYHTDGDLKVPVSVPAMTSSMTTSMGTQPTDEKDSHLSTDNNTGLHSVIPASAPVAACLPRATDSSATFHREPTKDSRLDENDLQVVSTEEHEEDKKQEVKGQDKVCGASLLTSEECASAPFFDMLDVGNLAPKNAGCAACDRHDYLHQFDLPAHLISPCYHCRLSLAQEAKITAEDLLDLHLQHNVPWPAFLQAYYKIPVDGRTVEELIAYDCRWRSRQACTCLVQQGGPVMPPCTEFSWLYQPLAPTTDKQSSISCIVDPAGKRENSPKLSPHRTVSLLESTALQEQQQQQRPHDSTEVLSNRASSADTPTKTATTPSNDHSINGELSKKIEELQPEISTDSVHNPVCTSSNTPPSGTSSTNQRFLLPCSNRHARGLLSVDLCCPNNALILGGEKERGLLNEDSCRDNAPLVTGLLVQQPSEPSRLVLLPASETHVHAVPVTVASGAKPM